MLLPFLLCVLIVYIPLPLGDTAMQWPAAAIGVALLALLNAVFAWAGSGLAVRLSDAPGTRGGLAANKIFSLLKGGVVGFVLADVFAFKWPVLVEELLGDHLWALLLGDLLLLLPAVVMILTVMACQHRFEYRRGRVSLSLRRYLWLRFRVELAIILVPWLILVLVTDLAGLLSGGSELADSVSSGLVLVLVVVFSPLLLRTIWTTSPLPDGPLRQRLDAFCKSNRFRCHDILLWHTHNHLANAGLVGPTPLLRYVLLTDALVQRCTEEEVEAIFSHEVGHVRHHHLAFYMLFAVAFLCFYLNLVDLVALTGWVAPVGDILAFHMTAEQGAIMLAFAAIYWGVIFGFVSRRIEQQADVFSLRSVANPHAFLSALARLAAVGSTHRAISSWRHFSIERRIGFLRDILSNPSKADRFQLRITAIQLALVVLLAAGLARLVILRPDLWGL